MNAEQRAARAEQFERELTVFDKTAVRMFTSFKDAEQVDREYWLSRTPEERMKALEHIRQLAWGYDEESRPEFQRLDRVFQLRGSEIPDSGQLRG